MIICIETKRNLNSAKNGHGYKIIDDNGSKITYY